MNVNFLISFHHFLIKKGSLIKMNPFAICNSLKSINLFFIFVHLHCAAFTLKKFYYNFIVSL